MLLISSHDFIKLKLIQYLCMWPEQPQESEILSYKGLIYCKFNTTIHISLQSMHITEWYTYNTKTLMPANPILKWRLYTEEWVNYCGLTPSEHIFRYITAGTSYIQWHVIISVLFNTMWLFSGESANDNFIFFGLTRPELDYEIVNKSLKISEE